MTSETENLVIIMSDEHQGQAMGNAAHPFVKTPNIDRLASNGTVFSNAYTPCPICVPARACFATGLPAHLNRLWDNAMPYFGQKPSWGHSLQDNKTSVESIGKLHYRSENDNDGFDKKHIPMMVVNGVGMVWGSIRREDQRIVGKERMLGKYIGPGNSKYTDYDLSVVEKSKQWFESKAKTASSMPWCLYIGLVAPHFPLVVPKKFYDLYPEHILPDTKLNPRDGFVQHPWIKKQIEARDSEEDFKNEKERLDAISSYYGLCSFLDFNIGEILKSIEKNGFKDNTTIIYTSDHGDNVGARGLWGKSNFYEESANIPMIISGNNIKKGKCKTPVSLLDLTETIVDHFDCKSPNDGPGKSLYKIIDDNYSDSRIVFSEYHAVLSVSGAYMIRKGNWKYIYYCGFDPELFDLEADPAESINLAFDNNCIEIKNNLHEELLKICDPEEINRLAFYDQDKLIESFGGINSAKNIGAPGATPPPTL